MLPVIFLHLRYSVTKDIYNASIVEGGQEALIVFYVTSVLTFVAPIDSTEQQQYGNNMC